MNDMDLVYSLRTDAVKIRQIQEASLHRVDAGLVQDPALFGSDAWWNAIDNGVLETHPLQGKVTAVYWGSMRDWPMFSLRGPEDEETSWTREGDISKYLPGLRCELSYVLQAPKKQHFPDRIEHHKIVLEIRLEESRLRSLDVAPGPFEFEGQGLAVLYRPVGQTELELIERSGRKRFPPRLPEQPIFYPVLSEQYAARIAKDWNTKDPASGSIGYVTQFCIRTEFLGRYEIHDVGGREYQEYWIPAEELDEFNENIVGRIAILARYVGQ